MGELAVNIPVKDHGTLTETYGKNEMPVRIDYSANYIATDPETKKKEWIYSDMDGEVIMTGPRTGCAGIYRLDNSPGNDLLAGSGTIMIDRECTESDISGSYEGDFSFNCQGIDYKLAMETIDTDRVKEELQNTKNAEGFESDEPGTTDEDGSMTGGGTNGIEPSQQGVPAGDIPTGEEINYQLEQLKQEMQNGAAESQNR